jgi:hypothetical protein
MPAEKATRPDETPDRLSRNDPEGTIEQKFVHHNGRGGAEQTRMDARPQRS